MKIPFQYNVSDTTYQPGGGGEYDVQTGFGWSNGAVLDLLRTYGARLVAPQSTTQSPTGAAASFRIGSFGVIISQFFVFFIVTLMTYRA